MELEELKSMWTSVNERLEKQELLKESIIREMIREKSNKSLSKLLNMEIFSVVVMLSIFIFIVYMFERLGKKWITVDVTFIFCEIYCIVWFLWYLYKIYGLMKIDFSGNIKDNLFYINKYTIQIKWEKIAAIFLTPIIAILLILVYIEMKAGVLFWIMMSCGFILATLFTYYQYKKIYDKNILSIRKSLEELKELEE